MRIPALPRNLLLLLLAATPMLARAQFQAPTAEELKMTAEPKAPGAAAVYLYREETTDDTLHFHSYYERIKVLAEKGKELATVRIPYEHGEFSVTDIQGRTIHADGTVIPLTAKPADLMDFKSKNYQRNTMVFTLPSVEVGSIIEYRLKLRYSDEIVSSPTWDIQQEYFVQKAHYFFRPEMGPGHIITGSHGEALTYLMYSTRMGSGQDPVVRDQRGSYTVDVADIPALPDEDWMPPLNTLKWRVEFYYTSVGTGAAFWESAGKTWAKEAQEFSNPSGFMKKAVAEIVGPTDSDEQKATKIYAAVMKLNNTRFSRKRSEAERKAEKLKVVKSAEDVWKQQGGSDDEIALLYVALGRAAGLKVYPMQVTDRSRAIFDNRYLSTNQLNDYIAVVVLDGKEVYLDPGQKMCPFGTLHWKHSYAMGFRLTDGGPVPATTPGGNYKLSAVQQIADLTVDETGGVKGTVHFVMTGPEALHWRQMALENDQEEVQKRFKESVKELLPEGVECEFDHFMALDDYTTNLQAYVNVTGSVGTVTGKHLFLPGMFFESRAKHPFVAQDKRAVPVDVHYPKLTQDSVNYHLPAGFSVESAPTEANTAWPDNAILKVASATKAGSVTVVRTLAYNYSLVDPKDYSKLHDFYQKVATADQQQLVLAKAPAAKGN